MQLLIIHHISFISIAICFGCSKEKMLQHFAYSAPVC